MSLNDRVIRELGLLMFARLAAEERATDLETSSFPKNTGKPSAPPANPSNRGVVVKRTEPEPERAKSEAGRMTGEEFQRSGLLYLANRALHPFGVAIGVTVLEDGTVLNKVSVFRSDDPTGLTFSDEDETECRRRLAEWTRENWRP